VPFTALYAAKSSLFSLVDQVRLHESRFNLPVLNTLIFLYGFFVFKAKMKLLIHVKNAKLCVPVIFTHFNSLYFFCLAFLGRFWLLVVVSKILKFVYLLAAS
jgi:hypothetical protein